jgi:hypothetical protein
VTATPDAKVHAPHRHSLQEPRVGCRPALTERAVTERAERCTYFTFLFIYVCAHHVHALRVVREEVGDAPVLLDVVLGVGLERVHHVRELDAVAHEEHLPRRRASGPARPPRPPPPGGSPAGSRARTSAPGSMRGGGPSHTHPTLRRTTNHFNPSSVAATMCPRPPSMVRACKTHREVVANQVPAQHGTGSNSQPTVTFSK